MPLELPSMLLPSAGEVHVYRVSLDREVSLLELLSEGERERAGRFHFERDARRWIAGRTLLRRMLERYLDTAPKQLQIETNFWGKPGLPGCPLRFNVTHSGDTALLAFAWRQEIGIDIERSRCDFDPLALAAQICSTQEHAALRILPPEQQHSMFLTLWTGKEAYVKARGEGLSFPLTELTLTPLTGTDRFHVRDLDQSSTQLEMSVCRLNLGELYFGALALEGRLTQVHSFDHSHAPTN
ncbi:MAG: 4'-phosphopantetheinyl transferase family protein [Janthinobacterium lividum]